MKRVAIIGGGIAGLSAAFYLEKARRSGTPLAWTLFEKSGRLGGVIKTEHRDDYVLEAGPDSFLTAKPDGAQLCRDLGIGGQLISSNDSQRKTYILVQGRLVPIPDGLQFMVPTRLWPMVTTPLFSWPTKFRMAAELFSRSGIQPRDESVAEFVRRHFGQEMAERVAEPLLAGVYGGDAANLSVRAVLPRFVEMEREHGSLVKAALRASKTSPARSALENREGEVGATAQPQPLFTSLKNGMQQMVDALVAQLPANSVRLRQQDLSLRRSGDDWLVESAGNGERYDAVLLAVPAPAAAALLRSEHEQLAGLLEKIQYTSSAAVALAYAKADLSSSPGHGLLVPRAEKRQLLACTFVHKKFMHRAPEGSALLRCFISSARLPGLLNLSDSAIEEIVLREVKEILGLSAKPTFTRVFRWECALPQYETGHLERVAAMETLLAAIPGAHIIGNSFHGIGIPDCIRSARLAVERITADVLQPAPAG
ncbi:MAG TPA: protoporphyrinogen oxidase [Candidatus Angelobacter sp.]